MPYILIVILTMSGVTTSYIKVTTDAVTCLAEAGAIRQAMSDVPAEWVLKTRCVPVTGVKEV
jgi:hypothetical protein